ncbi:ABC transporter substrate-binding protein [Paenibacillus ferrarius]|uniref:ABC transporter substrate-binding protein n=1 Tax=Paenibacillus ferrarius TaxID=1469647 RepID=UPI003D2C743E
MKFKKSLSVLAGLTLAASVVTACGSSSSSSSPSPEASASATASPAAAPKEKVTLTMWGGVPAENGPQAAVDAWNAKNPNVQVKYERYVNDDAGNMKLDTALTTGQNVDLYVNYTITNLTQRLNAGTALDLSKFTDYKIDEKIAGASSWQINNKYYALPTSKSHYFVWMNKDLLDQAGLKVPTAWTWDDMKQYADKLKSASRYGLVQHTEPFPDSLDAVSTMFGYTKKDGTSNLNDPLIGKWMETLKSMMDDGKATPKYSEQIVSKMPVDTVFLKGEAGMLNAGTWIFRSSNNMKDNPRTFKIAFAPVPRLTTDSKDYIVRGGVGDAISINPKSKYIDQAWEFLKWYADGGMMPLVSGGRFPASNAANQDEIMKALLGDQAATYDLDSLKNVLFNNTPKFTRNLPKQVLDLRQEEYEKYFTGKQSIKDTLDNMAKRHNDFLKQNK